MLADYLQFLAFEALFALDPLFALEVQALPDDFLEVVFLLLVLVLAIFVDLLMYFCTVSISRLIQFILSKTARGGKAVPKRRAVRAE